MTTPRLIWDQGYPGGRLVARLGRVEVGAVFPGTLTHRWWFWVGGMTDGRSGDAKSVQAAQNALTAHLLDWLRAAGLKQAETEDSQ